MDVQATSSVLSAECKPCLVALGANSTTGGKVSLACSLAAQVIDKKAVKRQCVDDDNKPYYKYDPPQPLQPQGLQVRVCAG